MQYTSYPPRPTARIAEASSIHPGPKSGSTDARGFDPQLTSQSPSPGFEIFSPKVHSKLEPQSDIESLPPHDFSDPREQDHVQPIAFPPCAALNAHEKQVPTSKGTYSPLNSLILAPSSHSVSVRKQHSSSNDRLMDGRGTAGISGNRHSDDVSPGMEDAINKECSEGAFVFCILMSVGGGRGRRTFLHAVVYFLGRGNGVAGSSRGKEGTGTPSINVDLLTPRQHASRNSPETQRFGVFTIPIYGILHLLSAFLPD